MKKSSRVLRVPLTDDTSGKENDQVVLVNVTKEGSVEFDVVATDNDYVYHTKLNKTKINASKDKKFKVSEDEWHEVVRWALLRIQPQAEVDITRVELEASSKAGKEFTITIRRNLEEIQPRLGSFSIPVDNDYEIDLFNWGKATAHARNRAESELEAVKKEKQVQQQTIEKLTSQLDEFVKEKKNHEEQMLEKFRQLLNTKKLKIRDQQRLLKSAKIDPVTAETKGLQALSDEEEKPAVGSKKRKASTQQQHWGKPTEDVPMADAETDVSEGLPDERALATPDRSDMEDEETEDKETATAQVPNASSSKGKQLSSSPAEPSRQLPVQTRGSTQKSSMMDEDETDDEL